MTKTEKFADLLLCGIRRELARLSAIETQPLGRDEWQLRVAVNDAKIGIVAAEFPVLLGRGLDAASQRVALRAAEWLEARGKIVRLRLGYDQLRVTHLQVV